MDSRAAGEMLKDRFPAAVQTVEEFRGETTVTIDGGALREVMRFLKEDEAARYDLLVDIAGADFGGATPRFTVAYLLHSMRHNNRLRIKTGVAEGAEARYGERYLARRPNGWSGRCTTCSGYPSPTIPT